MDKSRNEVKFLGSLVLLVAALAIFVALLVYFAPEKEQSELPSLASEETQLLRQKTRVRPLRDEHEETQSLPRRENTEVVADSTPPPTEIAPNDEELKKAIELVDGGNPDDALAILEKIINRDPKNERALIEVSMIHLIDYKDAAAAIPWLERTLQVNPSNRLVLAELAAICAEQDSVEHCMQFMQSLQKDASPKDASFLSLGIGQMLLSDGRGDEAVGYIENAAAGQPHNPHILSSLANTYARRGNSDKAIATYRKSVAAYETQINQLSADDKGLPSHRALLLRTHLEIVKEFYQRGDLDAASEELEAVSKHAPDSPLIANWRTRIARRAG